MKSYVMKCIIHMLLFVIFKKIHKRIMCYINLTPKSLILLQYEWTSKFKWIKKIIHSLNTCTCSCCFQRTKTSKIEDKITHAMKWKFQMIIHSQVPIWFLGCSRNSSNYSIVNSCLVL